LNTVAPACLSRVAGLRQNFYEVQDRHRCSGIIRRSRSWFSLGSYRTRQVYEEISERSIEQTQHRNNWSRVSTSTQLLHFLADGEPVKARLALERQLDVAVVQLVAYEKLYNPESRGGLELAAVREARDYRSKHPWMSEPHNAQAVQLAFKWVN
jgi:hypothetical protein